MSVFAAATGIGSWPGTSPRHAAEVIDGELHQLPYLPELPARGVGADMIGRTGALLIDVRRREDYDAGHISGARFVPGETIADGAESLSRFKEKTIIAYCDTGMTAGSAARHLGRLGFKHALNLRGGIAGWRQDNLPVVKD